MGSDSPKYCRASSLNWILLNSSQWEQSSAVMYESSHYSAPGLKEYVVIFLDVGQSDGSGIPEVRTHLKGKRSQAIVNDCVIKPYRWMWNGLE